MEKNEALDKITDLIEKTKLMPPFTGRAKLVIDLKRWYDMVNLYKPIANYDYLCWKEAEGMFNYKMNELMFLHREE